MSFLTKTETIFSDIKLQLAGISANTLGWLAIILLHLSSVPTLLSILMAQSDKMPPVDLMIFMWAALITLFFKSLIERNFLYITTISVGFVAQTVMMGLILYK